MTRSARAMSAGAALSLVLHAILAYVLPSLAEVRARREAERAPAELALEVHLERAGDGALVRVSGEPIPVTPGGSEAIHNVDARDRGEGGDASGAQEVINFLPRADEITLTDAPMNALGIGQTQRIDTGRERASLEDRRATPHPDDDPFLASGSGIHPERRPLATIDPRAGARTAPRASSVGMPLPGSRSPVAPGTGAAASSSGASSQGALGAEESSPGRGILEGRGARDAESARVAFGRPSVDEARAATTTEQRDARTRDDANAEQLAAQMLQQVVEATERRGRIDGPGRGGALALGRPGVGGGSAEGGRAAALGPGRGAFDALDTGEERYRRWLRDLHREIEAALDFPHQRELSMDQGTSVYVLIVRRDGTLARAPRLIRSSGFEDLDGAALAAIQSTAPYSPLPDDIAPGRPTLEVRLPIEFSNPMVQ